MPTRASCEGWYATKRWLVLYRQLRHSVEPDGGPGDGPGPPELRPGPQPAAFFTISAIFFASDSVIFVIAHDVGHIEPSSSSAPSSKPSVA
jgi:hypothetical protein